jgi:hypothetical protein
MALAHELMTQHPEPAALYRAVGEWLATSTPKKATVGYLEVGYIGYYSHRRIIDPLGLVTPGPTAHIREGDIAWAYREMLPDYILVNPPFMPLLGPFQQEPWFSSCYRKVAMIKPIDIYQRCPVMPRNDAVVQERAQLKTSDPSGELLPGRTIGQTFTAHQNGLRSVGLLVATYGKQLKGPLVFHLREAGNESDLVILHTDLDQIQDNSWKLFNFRPIGNSAGRKFYAYLDAPESRSGDTMTLWSMAGNPYPSGELMINHVPAPGDLSLLLYYVKP